MNLLTADFQFGLDGLGSASIGVSIGLGSIFSSTWGIYSGGSPIIVADTVTGFDYKQEWSLSDFPVERGAFETYDKVQLPFDVRVRFVAGDTLANRSALLGSLAAIAGTTQLFDAVTPEATYTNVNITHYDYRRSARRGLGLLEVDVWCLEVRQGAMTIGTSTASPSASAQQNGGSVQPTTASPAQKTGAIGGIGHM